MPEVNSLVLTDGKSTPVTHTFNRHMTNGSTAQLVNPAADTLKGRETFQFELRPPVGRDGAVRIRIGLGLPVEAVVDSQTVVSRLSSGEVILNFSQAGTAQERLDLLALFASALVSTEMKDAVENVEPFY